jgi:hypothetical protein
VEGEWSAPDLGGARRLVTDSDTRGMRVAVLGITDDLYPPGDVARVAARALSQLGYRVDLRMMTRADLERLPEKEQNAFDVAPFRLVRRLPVASELLPDDPHLPAPLIHGRICDQKLDRQINHAMLEEATGSGPHGALWSAIDRRATQEALTVPLVNPRSVELTPRDSSILSR